MLEKSPRDIGGFCEKKNKGKKNNSQKKKRLKTVKDSQTGKVGGREIADYHQQT